MILKSGIEEIRDNRNVSYQPTRPHTQMQRFRNKEWHHSVQLVFHKQALPSGPSVIKLFKSVIYTFYTKLECLLDQAWKVSKEQKL